MINTQPISTSVAPSPAPAASTPPAAPPAPPKDDVQIGTDEPSKLYRFGRGAAATVGGLACGVVGAGTGGVQHAGDQSVQVPRALVRSAAICGAALGLAHGVVAGLGGGPIGLAIGIITGPTIGAFVGGGAVLGAATAVDALKGSAQGARAGFHTGFSYVSDVVDRMAGRGPESKGCGCAGGCDCATPAPPQADPKA